MAAAAAPTAAKCHAALNTRPLPAELTGSRTAVSVRGSKRCGSSRWEAPCCGSWDTHDPRRKQGRIHGGLVSMGLLSKCTQAA
jgi:hypothetical protein